MTTFRPEYEFEKRTLLIGGKQSSLAMEALYWRGVERIARERNLKWQEIVLLALDQKPRSFSSRAGWLRIWVFAKILESTKRKFNEKAAG
jgi:predicted DNA-binding ribbon-helix-helix protein